jgi:osmotically-inducible protein OsmY
VREKLIAFIQKTYPHALPKIRATLEEGSSEETISPRLRGTGGVERVDQNATGAGTGETAGEKIDDATITTEANALIVKDRDAQYLKIDVDTRQGNVVVSGFVNSKETEGRIVGKIREIRGVKSVKTLLKVEEKK